MFLPHDPSLLGFSFSLMPATDSTVLLFVEYRMSRQHLRDVKFTRLHERLQRTVIQHDGKT